MAGGPAIPGFTGNPVNSLYGHKLEVEGDLYMPLTGRDFALVRSYTSNPDAIAVGHAGEGWTLNVMLRLDLVDIDGNDEIAFATPSGGMSYFFETSANSEIWTSPGAPDQVIMKDEITVDSTTWQVYKVVRPGKWVSYHIRKWESGDSGSDPGTDTVLMGQTLRTEDFYGNKRDYEWSVGGSGTTFAKLDVINLFNSSGTNFADVEFSWETNTSDDDYGRCLSAGIKLSGETYAQQKVTYTYYDAAAHAGTLGSVGDLVQVVQETQVDADPSGAGTTSAPVYYPRVTQYRYHVEANNETTDSDGDGVIEKGGDHQLKLVIEPTQIEFYAQQLASASDTLVTDESDALLDLDEEDALNSSPDPLYDQDLIDLAAKVIPQYHYDAGESKYIQVKHQHLQTGCGCSGSGASIRLSYEYFWGYTDSNNEYDRSTKITKQIPDGMGGWTDYQYTVYDSQAYDPTGSGEMEVYLLRNVAVSDGVTSPDWWVTHFDYDDPAGSAAADQPNPRQMNTPAACSSYTMPDANNAPEYTPASSGLVFAYEYNDEDRLTKVEVLDGDGGSADTVTTIDWGEDAGGSWTDSNSRDHLISQVKRYWTSGSTSDVTQTTKIFYEFYSTTSTDLAYNAVKSTETQLEKDLVAENGPVSSEAFYSAHTLFDSNGRAYWRRLPDERLIKQEFDSNTGQITKVVYNAPTTGLPSHSYGTWNGRNNDGEKLEYTATYDDIGRKVSSTSPGGITRYIVRELKEHSERPNLLYFAMTQLPPLEGSSPAAPASVLWMNAASQGIGGSDYSLKADTTSPDTYDDLHGYDFEFDQEVAKVAYEHDLASKLVSAKVWHRVSDTNAYYETAYTHDDHGRVRTVTTYHQDASINQTEKTVTRYSYDIVDRVTKVEVGTELGTPGNMKAVAEYYYDSGLTTTPGIGNGLLTVVEMHEDTSTTRTTKMIYDERDRLVKVVNDLPPHSYFEYDFLDRVTVAAEYAAVASPPTNAWSDSDRLSYTEFSYGQRGAVYREAIAIDPDAGNLATAGFLETHYWYDEGGRVVGMWGPNSAGVKVRYDGLGRATDVYVTDRGGDPAPGAASNYTAVYTAPSGTTPPSAALAEDIVLKETEARYIEDSAGSNIGVMDLVTHRQRTHDASSSFTGALADASGANLDAVITTFASSYYDDINRVIRSVDYGTNTTGFVSGGSAPTVNQAIPLAASDAANGSDYLVTEIAYDNLGRIETVTDSKEEVTKAFYDDLYRVIALSENHVNASVTGWDGTNKKWTVTNVGTGSAGLQDEDRVTSYVYRAGGEVWKQIAHNHDGTSATEQLTEYVYGAADGTKGSVVNSGALLAKVVYPDSDEVYFGYNRLGEIIRGEDQNSTVHEYDYDLAGRLIEDEVTSFGTNIDQAVDRITATYDIANRQFSVISEYTPTTTTRNAVRIEFDELGALKEMVQDPDGALTFSMGSPTGTTYSVPVTMSTANVGSGNYHRPASWDYPDGTTLEIEYFEAGGSAGLDDAISRVRNLVFDSVDFVGYEYMGSATPVVVEYAVPDVFLNRALAHNGDSSAGEYPAFDRFGRLVRHIWADVSIANNSSDTSFPTIPPILELAFQYDDGSNPIERFDDRTGQSLAFDHEYDYDGLDRLEEALRGATSSGSFVQGEDSQAWTLDVLGNWLEAKTDEDGDGNYTDPGETVDGDFSNLVNELEELDDGTNQYAFTYDAAGNLRTKEASGSVTYTYTHDAWNRLVEVERTIGAQTGTIGEYEYNGMMWRTVARSDSDLGTGSDALDEQRVMYYSPSWQILEEHVYESWSSGSPGSIDAIYQNVWGLRYIDDLVHRRVDNDVAAGWEVEHFAITDQNFSVVALIDDVADVVEWVTYDAYGQAAHHAFGDVDGDGDYDSSDRGLIYTITTTYSNPQIHQSGYDAAADLDRDGDVDSTDVSIASGLSTTTALPLGQLSSEGNIFGFSGYVYNRATGLYLVRFRSYDVEVGRWAERDPLGYVDGANLYQYVGGTPIAAIDPFGLIGYYSPYDNELWDDLPSWMNDSKKHRKEQAGQVVDLIELMLEVEKKILLEIGFALAGGGAGKIIGRALGKLIQSKFGKKIADAILKKLKMAVSAGGHAIEEGTLLVILIGGKAIEVMWKGGKWIVVSVVNAARAARRGSIEAVRRVNVEKGFDRALGVIGAMEGYLPDGGIMPMVPIPSWRYNGGFLGGNVWSQCEDSF